MRKKVYRNIWFKALGSFGFVIMGALGFHYAVDTVFAALILAGLMLGAIADVVIDLRFFNTPHRSAFFIGGTGIFIVGHIMYLLAVLPRSMHILICIGVGLIAAMALLFVFSKVLVYKRIYKYVAFVYVPLIIVMSAVAVGAAITRSSMNAQMASSEFFLAANLSRVLGFSGAFGAWAFAAGCILFALSDTLLLLNNFGKYKLHGGRTLTLSVYYAAQYIIAISLFYN